MTAKKIDELVKGDFACVTGFGTANVVHEHHEVVRVTNLYIVSTGRSNLGPGMSERRHRRDSGSSVPRGDGYGGTYIHASCKRRKVAG